MFTLTNASSETKAFLKWGAIILGAVLAVFIFINLALMLKSILYPTPPPAPKVAFGKIPPAKFGQSAVNGNFSYILDTVSGFLPQFPTVNSVYKFYQPKPDLIGLQKATDKVNAGGFVQGPFKLADNEYSWTTGDNEALVKTIKVNILNNTFDVSSNFLTNPDVIAADNLPDTETAISTAKTYLAQMGFLTSDLDTDNPSVKIFSIQSGKLIEATSISNTQIIQVNFFPKAIENIPVYYSLPRQSNINVMIAGGSSSEQVVQATYHLNPVSDQFTTYPIITAAAAFDELKKGKAYIAEYDGTSKNIYIKDVFLAFYDSGNNQDLLMPIIVFKGNDNFYAYVNAVTDEWISK